MDIQSVLVIDDEDDIRSIAELALSGLEEWTVYLASSGTDGLELASANHPDLVLLDLNMPGLSGLETLERLRRDESLARIPVLMMTGQANQSDRAAYAEAGARGVIQKPFDPLELPKEIRAALG